MTAFSGIDESRYVRARIAMLRLLLSGLAEDESTRESRVCETTAELLQQDTDVTDVLGVTLRYLVHTMELGFGSAEVARERLADELAVTLQQNGFDG